MTEAKSFHPWCNWMTGPCGTATWWRPVSHEQGNLCLVAQLCPILWDPMDRSPPCSSVHGNSPGQNTGVGCHALLQGIFPTQGSSTGLPHCRQSLYCLSHQESPRILEWVAYPLSRGSSWPRNLTGFSCTAGGFFTSWATGKAWNLAGPIDHPTVGNSPTSAALTQFICGRIENIYGQGRHLLLAGGTPQALDCHSAPHPLLGFLSLKLIWFL